MEDILVTMIMPTFNHPTYIEYFLNNAIISYNGNLFRFEIHDSSENDETKKIIDKFNACHTTQIKYFRYISTMNGDFKTYKALSQCQTSHMYLMGDGVCPDFNKLEKYLEDYNFSNYDLFGIFVPEWIKRFKKEKYAVDTLYTYQIDKFFAIFFHEFTYYGGSIISRKIWNYILEKSIFETYQFNGRYSYAYDSSVFTALALDNNFKYCASFISFYRGNPMKKANGWGHSDSLYQIGVQEFENDVNKLPSIYDFYKQSMYKKSRQVGFNFRSCLYYRLHDSLNFKLIKKYKKDLKHVKLNYYMLFFTCFIPKWFIKLGAKIKRLLKKILRRA